MGKRDKLLIQILRGTSDSNIPFDALCNLLQYIGFELRIKGSHHILWRHDIPEILNLQPINSLAKAYQVKQIRQILTKHKLTGEKR